MKYCRGVYELIMARIHLLESANYGDWSIVLSMWGNKN